ncbi:MAG: hypothetical protein M1825_006318 [Sarcosagium campestre]|nr:MAG: hypothetical protein M1825_006318 [Sarcosagium campestre]
MPRVEPTRPRAAMRHEPPLIRNQAAPAISSVERTTQDGLRERQNATLEIDFANMDGGQHASSVMSPTSKQVLEGRASLASNTAVNHRREENIATPNGTECDECDEIVSSGLMTPVITPGDPSLERRQRRSFGTPLRENALNNLCLPPELRNASSRPSKVGNGPKSTTIIPHQEAVTRQQMHHHSDSSITVPSCHRAGPDSTGSILLETVRAETLPSSPPNPSRADFESEKRDEVINGALSRADADKSLADALALIETLKEGLDAKNQAIAAYAKQLQEYQQQASQQATESLMNKSRHKSLEAELKIKDEELARYAAERSRLRFELATLTERLQASEVRDGSKDDGHVDTTGPAANAITSQDRCTQREETEAHPARSHCTTVAPVIFPRHQIKSRFLVTSPIAEEVGRYNPLIYNINFRRPRLGSNRASNARGPSRLSRKVLFGKARLHKPTKFEYSRVRHSKGRPDVRAWAMNTPDGWTDDENELTVGPWDSLRRSQDIKTRRQKYEMFRDILGMPRDMVPVLESGRLSFKENNWVKRFLSGSL